MSNRLLLHVGHGKTGSSFIQQWLAKHTLQLELINISYPRLNLREEGNTSGNGNILLDYIESHHLMYTHVTPPPNILFSREQLARELNLPKIHSLVSWANANQFSSIEALLFIRDPAQHCYSLWTQKVKRLGLASSLINFSRTYDTLRVAYEFVTNASREGIYTTILNYDRVKSNLLFEFTTWLLYACRTNSLNPFDLSLDSSKRLVNIAPSEHQLRLMLQLNKTAIGRYLSPFFGKDTISRLLSAHIKSKPQYTNDIFSLWNDQMHKFNNDIQLLSSMPNSRITFSLDDMYIPSS